MLEENNLGLPDPDPLPGDDMNTPYFLIGDDAFPLRTWMMKPYSRRNLTNEERIFNYRLSRARRVVENAFGLLAMRFQCLLGCLNQMPETVDLIILACVTLHNLISIRYPAIARLAVDQEDEHNQLVPGEWRQGRQLADGDRTHGRNVVTSAGVSQRNYIKHYFNSRAGSVEWQQNMI
ncbi:HARB1-like protein [Mya arenaria]|uniref:HARB1-like protein n=3 Tax=Neoheterodontei TaxID=2908833 RepID=A0ABY7FFN3_MYAAR|nr:HARB1-like protein [Mya arenaria]WAR17193.1 HARB1-like protein [Mya arenaria]WAR19974.1 HARB1-like protein [Mya arenaria]WAR27738.1 HARB1-like protein [Mya arenaria]